MKWFREHLRVTILATVVLLLLTVTVASFLHQGSSSWLGGQVQRAGAFLQEPLAEGSRGFSAALRAVFQWKDLLAENRALAEENESLRAQLSEAVLDRDELAQLAGLTEALRFIDPQERFSYVTGAVIAKDGSRWYKTFTANVGSGEGVRRDAAVMNGDGLIGRVLDTGNGWSKVVSIVDENNSVSFQVFRDPGLVGVLTGDGKGGLSGYLLAENAAVVEGDVLVTSGMEIYPRGIPIGKVTAIGWDENSLLRTVAVEPLVDFNDLRIVTIAYGPDVETE